MQHAVFFVDAGCKVVGSGESEGWHVERLGTTREGCVTIAKTGAADGGEVESEEGAGRAKSGRVRFASVEFMRDDEWKVWERRRRGEDDGVGGWGWRGLL